MASGETEELVRGFGVDGAVEREEQAIEVVGG